MNQIIDNKKNELSVLINSLNLYELWEFQYSFVLGHHIYGKVKGAKLKMLVENDIPFGRPTVDIDEQFEYITYFYIVNNVVIILYIDNNGNQFINELKDSLFMSVIFNVLRQFMN